MNTVTSLPKDQSIKLWIKAGSSVNTASIIILCSQLGLVCTQTHTVDTCVSSPF